MPASSLRFGNIRIIIVCIHDISEEEPFFFLRVPIYFDVRVTILIRDLNHGGIKILDFFTPE
jgi:hypothetical protein